MKFGICAIDICDLPARNHGGYCHPHYSRAYSYNLTFEELNELSQVSSCQCCGRSLENSKRCYDHDHNTKKFRGVVCSYCNHGLGFLDKPELMALLVKFHESPPGLPD